MGARAASPTHKRVDMGGTFSVDVSAGVMKSSYMCQACNQSYDIVQPDYRKPEIEEMAGALWCFEGDHSSDRLATGDERRVKPNAVTLSVGPNLQKELDEVPADVRTLVVRSTTYDDSIKPTLERHLPYLEDVQLMDVAFAKVKLNKELTPNIKSLQLQNVPEECDLEIVLPKLKDVSLHYWSGPPGVVDGMLAAATKLSSFDSHKLWSNRSLRFASNSLQSVRLRRADCLGALELWAPRLVSLDLQACYGLESLAFLPTHPLEAKLKPSPGPPVSLRVNVKNASLSPSAMAALRANPRAVVVGEDDGDDGGGF